MLTGDSATSQCVHLVLETLRVWVPGEVGVSLGTLEVVCLVLTPWLRSPLQGDLGPGLGVTVSAPGSSAVTLQNGPSQG